MIIFTKLKERCISLKENKILLLILLLHLLLAGCHLYLLLKTDIQYHAELRIAGCLLIALLIFLFDRPGMAYGFLIYACTLIYINTFYNYGTVFFLLIASGAYPKIRWPAIVIYAINVFISFSLKFLIPICILIHVGYIVLFILITFLIYKVKPSKKLKLKDDEKDILSELAKGKLQKEIDLFSEQTITAKLKNARERNMCNSTGELVEKFKQENSL